MAKPKAYAYVIPDTQVLDREPVQVEAFDKIRQKKQLKNKRRWRRIRNVSLVIGTLTLFLVSPLANVKIIQVSGNEYLSKQMIIDQSELSSESHFYFLKTWEITEALKTNPLIETVKLKRHFGNEIEVVISEVSVMGSVNTDAGRMWILATGEQVPVQSNIRLNVPYFRNWNEEKGELLFSNLAKIPEDVQRQISEIAFTGNETDPEQIQLYMRDGNLVTISIRQIPDKLVFYFSIIEVLGNKRMHIHLEAGNYAIPL